MLSISSVISTNGTVKFCPAHVCMNPINHSINQSISLGIFPDDWECARVTPLFKQGDRDDLNSYRPISVISVVAKVMKEWSIINYMP